jgi:hypothetical protein
MKSTLIFLLVFINITLFGQNNIPNESPEILINYFCENLKNGDFGNLLKTYALYYDENINKLNNTEIIRRFTAILPQNSQMFPTVYLEFIKSECVGDYALRIRLIVGSLLLKDEFKPLGTANYVPLFNNENIEKTIGKFNSQLEIEKLNNLRLLEMHKIERKPKVQNNIGSLEKMYTINETVAYGALLELNNTYYYGGFTLVRYNTYWYILFLNSQLENEVTLGWEELNDKEEYYNRTK